MHRTALALTLVASVALLAPVAAQAQTTASTTTSSTTTTIDDPTSHPGPGRRAVCLDGVRTLWLTPEEEDIPGTAPTPGPCVPPGGTIPDDGEIVTLCIQDVTTTGRKGSTNPTGHLYPEGPCAEPAPPAAVKARPRFTG
jgi:hypothetical protein